VNSDSSIETVPYDEVYDREFDDPPHKEPDISKIQSTIQYDPKYSLDDIIDDVVEYTTGQSSTQPDQYMCDSGAY